MTLFPKGYQGRREGGGRKNWDSTGNGHQCTHCQGNGHRSDKKSKPSSRTGSGNVGEKCRPCNGTGWLRR